MPGHIATVALATLATAAPAHSARAHLLLSRHVAAASSLRSPPPTTSPPPQRAARHPRPHRVTHTKKARHPKKAVHGMKADHGMKAGHPRAVHTKAVDRKVAHSTADPAVTIADFHFTPPTTTVHVGDTITWTNDGPSSHTATASGGSFDTGTLSKGQSASHTFTTPGTFAYVCSIHPFMHGTITVLAAATSTSPTTTTSPMTTTSPTTSTLPATTSTAPTSTTQSAPATAVRAATAKPTLPVTGMDVLDAIAAGAVLVGSGLALRRAVRL